MLNIDQQVSKLRRMTVGELRAEYATVFGEESRSFHKEFLVRRIAWRVQANAEGGLPERARQRAMEIANDADLRTTMPGASVLASINGNHASSSSTIISTRLDVPLDSRLPMPGTLLTREYRGRTIRVRVLPKGFDYEGTVYRSLSAVARAVTGSHWNGYLFFNIPAPRDGDDR